jgi:D-beta-D-heptose 7-phosphate kinase/D-beta-D-heptose 1-phosphate adenosyltransferase
LISRFSAKKVIVLGDLMLDRYIWGDVSRISPEAPVPVVEVKKDTVSLGGAGNVVQNLASLGAQAVLTGIVGDDPEGRWVRDKAAGSRGVFLDRSRSTTVKTRIIAHHQQVVRVDLEQKGSLSRALEGKILGFIGREKCDGLIISDYNKGTVTSSLMTGVLSLAEKGGIPVFVDPKVPHFRLFSPVTLITPNHLEAEKIVGHACQTDAEVEAGGTEILSLISCRYLIIKRGEQGMTVFERGKRPLHIPTVAREVFDVTGAGDTVIAAASLALLAGATIGEAARIANAAAGVVVGKIGTAVVTPEELRAAMAES